PRATETAIRRSIRPHRWERPSRLTARSKHICKAVFLVTRILVSPSPHENAAVLRPDKGSLARLGACAPLSGPATPRLLQRLGDGQTAPPAGGSATPAACSRRFLFAAKALPITDDHFF